MNIINVYTRSKLKAIQVYMGVVTAFPGWCSFDETRVP